MFWQFHLFSLSQLLLGPITTLNKSHYSLILTTLTCHTLRLDAQKAGFSSMPLLCQWLFRLVLVTLLTYLAAKF